MQCEVLFGLIIVAMVFSSCKANCCDSNRGYCGYGTQICTQTFTKPCTQNCANCQNSCSGGNCGQNQCCDGKNCNYSRCQNTCASGNCGQNQCCAGSCQPPVPPPLPAYPPFPTYPPYIPYPTLPPLPPYPTYPPLTPPPPTYPPQTPPPPTTVAPTFPPPPITRCPTGTILINGHCQLIYCPPGMIMTNGKCTVIECPPGTVWIENRCDVLRPVDDKINITHIITTNFIPSPQDIILSNTNNFNVDLPINIVNNHETHGSGQIIKSENENCCTVKTPRICNMHNSRWQCSSRPSHRCGEFCTAPTIYLQPAQIYSRPNRVVMPPIQTQCQNYGTCGSFAAQTVGGVGYARGSDCSGCGMGMMQMCSPYCYRYTCPPSKCGFYDQHQYCSRNPGSFGCVEEDGCHDEWCL